MTVGEGCRIPGIFSEGGWKVGRTVSRQIRHVLGSHFCGRFLGFGGCGSGPEPEVVFADEVGISSPCGNVPGIEDLSLSLWLSPADVPGRSDGQLHPGLESKAVEAMSVVNG